MLRFHRMRAVALLIALGAPALPAQTPHAPAADPMSCGTAYTPQWDHCVGVLTYPNGNVYAGEFHHGRAEGLGMMVIRALGFSDQASVRSAEPNTMYAGEFRADRLNGYGLWLTPHGAYAGTFVNNIPQPDVVRRDCAGEPAAWHHCIGRTRFPDGNAYSGEFIHGVPDGFGWMEINSRGVADASGIRAPNQAFYVGQFKNGRFNGQGMLAMQNGTGVRGTFANNVLTGASQPLPARNEPSGAERDPAAALTQLMSDPRVQRQVIGIAARSQVVQYNPCPNARFTIDPNYVHGKPLAVDGMGRLTSGSWKLIVTEEGCGSQRQLNVAASIDGFGRVSMVPALPGTTRTEVSLQNDALRALYAVLATTPGAHEAHCNMVYVADTQYVAGDEGDHENSAPGKPWREVWTLTSCTQQIIVPMHFIPGATGTVIKPGPSKDIKVLPLTQSQEVHLRPEMRPERRKPPALAAGFMPAMG